MMRKEISVCSDPQELARRAAELFAELANQSVSATGRFAVAFSGGSTPRALYSLLADPSFSHRIPWSATYVFWGDERYVPSDHPESNYRMAAETLLSKVPIPTENIFRMPAENENAELAATEYEQALRDFFRPKPDEAPRFDLILLGLGEDGHTASLFAGTAALQERRRLVVANYVPKLTSFRLTLTLPVFNHAANVVFLVSGEGKASVVKEVLEGSGTSLPAQLIRPESGRLLFLLDRQGAKQLKPK